MSAGASEQEVRSPNRLVEVMYRFIKGEPVIISRQIRSAKLGK